MCGQALVCFHWIAEGMRWQTFDGGCVWGRVGVWCSADCVTGAGRCACMRHERERAV